MKTVAIVPQGAEYTLERLGRYVKTLKPGFHLLNPIIESIGTKINVRESVLEVPSQDVITKDNAAVVVDGVVFFQIYDVAKAAYEVTNLTQGILNLTTTNIRTVMGSMDLDELLSHREVINTKLLSVVDEATSPWGVKITRIEIKDIKPPRDLVESMGRQMKAERDKRASILEAEGERQSSILRAQGEKQSAIERSEGRKQSMILEAEARLESAQKDSEARIKLAEAEAIATKAVSEAVESGTYQALNYFVAQKYVEAFGKLATSPNQKIIFMPMETSSIISSIGGITELLKDNFKK